MCLVQTLCLQGSDGQWAVNWYRNYWVHNGLKTVNARRFPFDFHQTKSGKFKTSLRGELLNSSDDGSEVEHEDMEVVKKEEKSKMSAGVAVNKLPPFRVIDPKHVCRDLNPRLPKFRVLEQKVYSVLFCSATRLYYCLTTAAYRRRAPKMTMTCVSSDEDPTLSR